MPDILAAPSELQVGMFNDNLLSTQLDTNERLAGLFTDFNVPQAQHSIVPKDWNTDQILQSSNLPSRVDYLTSDDPKLRELAKNSMDQDALTNKALTKGFGTPTMVRYQEGQEKFTDNHWWNEAGKTKFGFNPYKTLAENEDFYHNNVWNHYSTVGQIWRGTGTFAGRALSKLVTGLVGMVGDIGSMAWNGLQEIVEAGGGPKNNFWADVSDNWLARTMEEADNYTKQQILPTYKSINYDNKGAFAKLTDSQFWTNDLADGAGFLLQFAIPGALFGKAAVLGKAGKLGRFGKVISAGVGELSTANSLQKGIGATLEFLTGSRNVGGIAAHVFNTTMEAVAEAKDGFKSTVDELMAQGKTKEEAQRIAAEHAPAQFALNMAILSVSNAFENKWFQQSVGNRINPLRSKINAAGLIDTKPGNLVGKFFAETKWGNRLYFYGKEGGKASIMEGYWEENAQLAAQRYAAGGYSRRGTDTPSEGTHENTVGFWKQLIKQTQDAASGKDREAADSIMAGAVIGILGGGLFSKFSGTRGGTIKDKEGNVISSTPKTFLPEGKRRQEHRENAELVAQVKNARDAWLTTNVMPHDLYKEDGTIDEAKAQARVDELNDKMAKVSSVFARKITLDQLIDPTERENKQFLLFGDYVKAHILNGSGQALVNRIRNWGNKTPEELALYGVDPEAIESPHQWADVAQNMIDEYTDIDKIKYANNTNESADSYFAKERAVKSIIFDYIASKQAALVTSDKYAEKKNEVNPFKDVDMFNSYNNLIARKLAFESALENKELPPDSVDYFKKKLADVQDQMNMRKEFLPEHTTGKRSDFIFQKDSDVSTQENDIAANLEDYLNFQFGEEDFKVSANAFDQLIKEYSDPRTGIKKWNDAVDYWEKAGARTRVKGLQDLGYTEAEISTMTPEEQQKLLENKTVKPTTTPVEVVKPVVKEKEVPAPTLAELEEQAREIVSRYDFDESEIPLNVGVKNMLTHITANPDQEIFDESEVATLTAYLQAFNEAAKAGLTPTSKVEKPAEEQPLNGVESEEDKKDEEEKEEEKKEEQPKEHAEQPDEHDQEQEEAEEINHPRMLISFSDIRKIGNTYFGYYIKPSANFENKTIQQLTDNPTDFRELMEVGAPSIERVKQLLKEMYENEKPPSTGPAVVPTSLLDEVKEAFRLQQQALENQSSFKDEADNEGMKIHNNKIDNAIDKAKLSGVITINTSNPKEVTGTGLKTSTNERRELARFNFMNRLASLDENKDDYKLIIAESAQGTLYGVLADKNGKVVGIDDSGKRAKSADPLLFFLDYDMFSPANISKRRSDVVQPPFPLAPLLASPGIAGQNANLQLRPPLEIHPEFVGKDVIAMVKARIKQTTVTASLDFVTQGLLYREGVGNSYSSIPNATATHKASDLLAKGHMRDLKGQLPLTDMFMDGIYMRAQRIQFPMLRNFNNKKEGTEIVEFRPLTLSEVTNEKGESIINLPIFQQAVEGTLESTKENLTTLTSLLRPDQFFILNLGSTIMVINLKKFKKFLNSDNITPEELRSLTTFEDLKNSPLNITETFYTNDNEVELLDGILGEGKENYSKFIHRNVVTSSIPVVKSTNSEGYARVNRRIVVTLDENIDDMAKAEARKAQIDKAPQVTDVAIDDDMTEDQRKNLINEVNSEEEIDLGDDFTETNCKV